MEFLTHKKTTISIFILSLVSIIALYNHSSPIYSLAVDSEIIFKDLAGSNASQAIITNFDNQTITSNTTNQTIPKIKSNSSDEDDEEVKDIGEIEEQNNSGAPAIPDANNEFIGHIIPEKSNNKISPSVLELFGSNENPLGVIPATANSGKKVRVIVNLNNIQEKQSILDSMLDFDKEVDMKSGFAGYITLDDLNTLNVNSDVSYIYLDSPMKISTAESFPLMQIDKASNKLYNNFENITGDSQTVCIVDTGVEYNHDQLGNCTGTQYLDGNCPKVIGGWDIFSNNNDPNDDNGHGTSLAGIIAANGPLYKGIAPGAKIVSVKITNSTGGSWTSLVDNGVAWCVDNASMYNITVIMIGLSSIQTVNVSTGCDGGITAMQVNRAVANNISVYAPSGNNITGITYGVSSPACITNISSISAVADGSGSGRPADFIPNITRDGWTPNRFPGLVDLMAPGSFIYVIDLETYGSFGGNAGGTSFASAHAAGSALLVLDYNKKRYNKKLTPEQLEYIFKATGKPIWDEFTNYSYPRIDVLAAIRYETNPPIINLETANNSMPYEGMISLEYNATDNEFEIKNCSLFINNAINSSDETITESATQQFNLSLPAGTYSWRIECHDNSSIPNLGVSETRTLNVQPIWSCFGINKDNPSVCNNHGSCVSQDTCVCSGGWIGADCSIPPCIENWTENFGSCQANDKKLKYYTDNNSCGTSNNLPADNGTYLACDYCTPSLVNSSWTEWQNISICYLNNTIDQSRNKTQYDSNSCNEINDTIYFEYQLGACDAPECYVDNDCNDSLICNGQESCSLGICMPGTNIDCSFNDLPWVDQCDYNPDNNPLTRDIFAGFTSICQEPLGTCTLGIETITSSCNISSCSAQCEDNSDCSDTECDTLDGCIGNDYYDYEDKSNNCLANCSCEANACSSPDITINYQDCITDAPDLKISGLRLFRPSAPNSSDYATFKFMIQNIGTQPAFNVSWLLNFTGFVKQSQETLDLAVGESAQVYSGGIFPSSGNYTITAILDPLNTMLELNKSNNQQSILQEII